MELRISRLEDSDKVFQKCIENLSQDIKGLALDIRSIDQRLVAHALVTTKADSRVDNLEGAVREQTVTLKEIQKSLADASKKVIPWGIIIPAIGLLFSVIVGMYGLTINPIKDDVAGIKAELRSEMVPRKEHEDRWRRFEEFKKGVFDSDEKLSTRIGKLEEKRR